MMAFERPTRAVVIGLDGGSFELLRPWLEEDELPCLSRLYREGVHGPLLSTVPPLSPEAWSTFMTGKHPGRHGVMNFLSFRPGSYELHFNSGADVGEQTLWRILSEAGRSVGIVGVPMTYPPEPVNGYLVAGLETPGLRSQFTYPTELIEELRHAVGGYDIHGDFLGRTRPEAYVARVTEMVDNQARAVRYLLRHYPADLSMFVIGATDRLQHCFWKFLDPKHPLYEAESRPALVRALRHAYARVDAAIESILAEVPDPKTVLVMSDHGFGPCHRSVHLNRWLKARGYLACASGSRAGYRLARGAWDGVSPYLPRWLKDWLKGRLPSVRGQVESFLLLSRIDWERTQAFSLSTMYGYIYANRTDRFPRGCVQAGAATDALLDAITRDLEDFTDPETGEPVVDRVCRVADLYPGPAGDSLPDLIVLWKEGYIARTDTGESLRGARSALVESNLSVGDMRQLISVEQSGSHRPEGIFIAHGPTVAAPGTIADIELADLAPTLLHLLGEPVPRDMDGRVIEELLQPESLQAYPVRYRDPGERPELVRESPYSAEEAKQVEEHLRGLGYLE